MKKVKINKIKNQMIDVGIDLNMLESLSRILIDSIRDPINLKKWDAENLSLLMSEKIIGTKQKFNNIEKILKI